MDKCRFKKGEIVSATKTFNGEIITGEFQGYRLFNDEIPDAVVGVVRISGDRSYDVDVTSIRHYESEDEKIRKELMQFCDDASKSKTRVVSAEKFLEWASWLEKQKKLKPVEIDEIIRKARSEGRQEVIDNPGYYQLVKPEEMQKPDWSEDDKNMWAHLNGYLNGFSCSEDAIKQMADWFYELPNRFNLQPKQEWSEEKDKPKNL